MENQSKSPLTAFEAEKAIVKIMEAQDHLRLERWKAIVAMDISTTATKYGYWFKMAVLIDNKLCRLDKQLYHLTESLPALWIS